ncbi:MAG: chromate resistance protein [Burkholderiales bacterium]|nr:chromate resistance protein [Burkholderiales bacterium]
MDASITPRNLRNARDAAAPVLVIDVRRQAAFLAATDMVTGALRRDPDTVEVWADELPPSAGVAVYCVHGHEVSQNVARALRERGLKAQFVEGGLEAWKQASGELMAKPAGAATRWVTRERPKVDRIACPWLVSRFVDKDAEYLYVPTAEVKRSAAEKNAIPYDIPDVHFSHEGERCSFDAFMKTFRLTDPALVQLADIVRGADTARLELAPQAAGLLALSLGLSRRHHDDHEMLRHGMAMYDALYLWCKEGQDERHTWNPDAYR